MLNLYIGYCQKLYTQHCHFLYIVNLLITDALLLLKMLHHCYQKCCNVVTKNAALEITENAAFLITVHTVPRFLIIGHFGNHLRQPFPRVDALFLA